MTNLNVLIAVVAVAGAVPFTIKLFQPEITRPKPTPIVAMFESEAGNPEGVERADLVATLMRPEHTALRQRLMAACQPLTGSPHVDWLSSTEGDVCVAASSAEEWANTKPVERTGYGVKSVSQQ